MQNSELFRRGVVLPLDDVAQRALETNDVDKSTRVNYLEIEDQARFDRLWSTKLFSRINEEAGSLIDDYEEAWVPPEKLNVVEVLVRRVQNEAAINSDDRQFLIRLLDLCSEAERLGRPVLFVL